MDYERKNESVFSKKVRAGKRRTYFFDVRETRGNDFYVTITESTKNNYNGRAQRHKIYIYKEDFNRFLSNLTETVDHVKTELMPDYDFDEFDRREEEYAKMRALSVDDLNIKSDFESEDDLKW